jgi:hypothetical protein
MWPNYSYPYYPMPTVGLSQVEKIRIMVSGGVFLAVSVISFLILAGRKYESGKFLTASMLGLAGGLLTYFILPRT